MDGERLLVSAGITRQQITDPAWRGDVTLLARLVQLVWFALDDELMGFIRRPSKPGTFAMMTHFILGEPTLEAALRKGVLFYSLVADGLEMRLDEREDEIVLTVHFADADRDPANYFKEFWLSIWCRLIGWLGGKVPVLERATFAYPRRADYSDELKYIFRCQCVFDALSTSIAFNRAFLQNPIVRDRAALKGFLSVAPVGFMMTPEDDTSFARRIRSLLIRANATEIEFLSFSEVASMMSMTEQTLRRRLRTEATSFRILKEEIRRDIAIQKLIENRLTVAEIGFLLGFSEPRAFTRAFHQWTGYSPVSYRRMLHEQFRSSRKRSIAA
ncbi:AraC family transcriptional regulator ligand-binding domain-containing protein [Xanthobacteraceae bacterium A53D]